MTITYHYHGPWPWLVSGLTVIYKPPGWEVDGHETEPDSHALRRMASHRMVLFCFRKAAWTCRNLRISMPGFERLEDAWSSSTWEFDTSWLSSGFMSWRGFGKSPEIGTLWCFQFRGFPTLSKTPWIHGRCMRVIVASCIAWTCRAVDWWGDTNSLRIPQRYYYCITIIS